MEAVTKKVKDNDKEILEQVQRCEKFLEDLLYAPNGSFSDHMQKQLYENMATTVLEYGKEILQLRSENRDLKKQYGKAMAQLHQFKNMDITDMLLALERSGFDVSDDMYKQAEGK